MASDGTTVFFAAGGGCYCGGLLSVPVAGGAVTTLVGYQAAQPPNAIAFDATSVYFYAQPADSFGMIAKVEKTGGAVTTLVAANAFYAAQLVRTGPTLIWLGGSEQGTVATVPAPEEHPRRSTTRSMTRRSRRTRPPSSSRP